MNTLEQALFLTESIRIAPSNKPFWYTSGTIGPYFINTHFLYGNEKEANKLLTFINDNKDKPNYFLPKLTEKIVSFYQTNNSFKEIMDQFYLIITQIKEFDECEYISGGERRDWFFSPIIAHLSNKKLLYIYKDLKVYHIDKEILDINGSKVSHICDLITQASSFQRAWIPAIKNINGDVILTASIVDRDEGGSQLFLENNIKYISAVKIDNDFLNKIKESGIIDDSQLKIIKDFKIEPTMFGRDFILNNPDFIKMSLNDESTKQKAERCINENPYKIDFKELVKNS